MLSVRDVLQTSSRGEEVVEGGFVPGAGSTAAAYRRIGFWMAGTDAACLFVALVLSYLYRYGIEHALLWDYAVVAALAPFGWVALFQASSLYAIQHLSAWEEFRRTIAASSIGMVLIVMVSFWSKSSFSRIWIGVTWVLVLLLQLGARRWWRWRVAQLKQSGSLRYRTIVAGHRSEIEALALELSRPDSGYIPVASSPLERDSGDPNPMSFSEEIEALVDRSGAECLFVATNGLDQAQVLQVVTATRRQGIDVKLAANLPEILTPRLLVQPVGRLMAISLKPVRLSSAQLAVKRAFDLLTTSIGIVVLSPLMMGVALAVKLSSRGPVLYVQERVTKGGKVFRMYKFRTMLATADKLAATDEIDTSQPFFKLEDDPRLTKLGAVLRRLSLDELPQLFNVLKGDMSLVGPRPLPADQFAANLELLQPRLEVPAGVTGWWQIKGRSDLDSYEAVQMDVFYIENWSLALDVFILVKTFGVVLGRRGAY